MVKELERRPSSIKEFTLHRKYIAQIKDGSKTSEGRINSGGFKSIAEGDKIKFFDGHEPNYNVLCEIIGIWRYHSFREMLVGEGYKTMIPDAGSLEEAIGIYNRIPSYLERAKANGVLAMRLRVINSSQNKVERGSKIEAEPLQ